MLPAPDSCPGQVPEVSEIWDPIPPHKMPTRLVKRKHLYDPTGCSICNMMGHNSGDHLVVKNGSRLNFIRRHLRAVTSTERLSAHERWHQLSIYPRMIRGYWLHHQQGYSVREDEVNAVLDAFSVLCPENFMLPHAPPINYVNIDHRGIERTFRNAVKDMRTPSNHADGEIAILNPHVLYTPDRLQSEVAAMWHDTRNRLADLGRRYECLTHTLPNCGCDLKDRWSADHRGVKYQRCTDCFLMGHNAFSCMEHGWAERLLMNTASACCKEMSRSDIILGLRNSLFGLVRLAILRPTAIHSVRIGRYPKKPLIMTLDDVISVHNSIIAHRFPDATRYISISDFNAGLVPMSIGNKGRQALVDFNARQALRVPKYIHPRPWIVDGHVCRFRDQAIGIVALLRGPHSDLARNAMRGILSTSDAHYASITGGDSGNKDVFELAVSSVIQQEISTEAWDLAEDLVQQYRVITIFKDPRTRGIHTLQVVWRAKREAAAARRSIL